MYRLLSTSKYFNHQPAANSTCAVIDIGLSTLLAMGSEPSKSVSSAYLVDAMLSRTRVDTDVVQRKFQELDKDGSGMLEVREIRELLSWMHSQLDDEVVTSAGVIINEDLSHEILRLFDMDFNNSLCFQEFCAVYEEIITRAELQRLCSKKFNEMTAADGFLSKEDTDVLADAVLQIFKKIGCTAKECDFIKLRLLTEHRSADGRIRREDLLELFHDMCVTKRLLRQSEAKFRELDIDCNGVLEGTELLRLADWMVHECTNKFGKLSEEMNEAVKNKLMSSFDTNKDGKIGNVEMSLIFESVVERKRLMQMIDSCHCAPLSPQNHVDVRRRRLSHYSFNELSEIDLINMGVTPVAREKFNELDRLKTGTVSRPEIEELVGCILRSYKCKDQDQTLTKEEMVQRKDEILNSFEVDLEQPLDFEEFCSLYTEVFIRVDVKWAWDLKLRELTASRDALVVEGLLELTDSVLATFIHMGYPREDCALIHEIITDMYASRADEECTAEELSGVFAMVCTKMRLFKNARKKFTELDTNKSGMLEDMELMELAGWMLSSHRPNGAMVSLNEQIAMKKSILDRFEKSEGEGINLNEMVILFEGVMEKTRWSRRLSFNY